MAIKLTSLGGTDWGEEALKPTDLRDTINESLVQIYSDNTGGSHSGDTTETDLATITITQNDLNSNATIVVNAGILQNATTGSGSTTGTYRLKVGGTTQKTITLSTADTEFAKSGTSFVYSQTAVDCTAGNVIVKITGQLSGNTGNAANCVGLTVLGYNR